MREQSNIKDFVIFLPILAGFLQLICLTYCGYFWKPYRMLLTDPDISWPCWLYCNALGREKDLLNWQVLSLSGAVLAIVSGFLLRLEWNSLAMPTTFIGGLILLPVGLLCWVPFFSRNLYRKRMK